MKKSQNNNSIFRRVPRRSPRISACFRVAQMEYRETSFPLRSFSVLQRGQVWLESSPTVQQTQNAEVGIKACIPCRSMGLLSRYAWYFAGGKDSERTLCPRSSDPAGTKVSAVGTRWIGIYAGTTLSPNRVGLWCMAGCWGETAHAGDTSLASTAREVSHVVCA